MSAKLLEFQKRVEAIKKDSQNPFFKSNYFDINSLLAEIKPLLNELELVLTQPLETRYINDKVVNLLVTRINDTDDKYTCLLTSEVVLPELQDPQKLGSAITYLRRYSLQTLLGLQAEDDDGNAGASKLVVKTVKPAATPTPKDIIAKLLQNASPKELKTADDYKDACKDFTGLELKPENYEAIIKSLK